MLLLGCIGETPSGTEINPEPLPLTTPSITPDPISDLPVPEGVLGSRAVADDGQDVGTELAVGTTGNRMAFSVTTLQASAGLIRIRFTNEATTSAIQHNLVIIAEGQEETIGVGGIQAGEAKHYLPDSPDVLAATPIVRAGESASFVVDLEPGTYSFICTFPGHYLSMRGTLTVV